MSKKKATMTLKDFHGGSIPSDLPLPSAPGVTIRPSDRPGSDRQVAAWGNPGGRLDHHRLRPGSAGSAVRNFDDKAPFLGPTAAHIGRNFDEDERKPLDGGWGPRRTVSDDSVQLLPIRAELKPEYSWSGPLPDAHVANSSACSEVKPDYSSGPLPVAHASNTVSLYAGRVSEAAPVGVNSQSFGGNSSYSQRFVEAGNVGVNSSNLGGNSVQGHPNAWAARKEAVKASEPVAATWSGPNAAAKLAHASALEKVSSGRWQSKQVIYHLPDVEVIRKNPIESEFGYKDDGFYSSRNRYHQVDMGGGVEYHDEMLARHAQRSLTADGGIRGGGEFPNREGVRTLTTLETMESNLPRYVPEVQPTRNDGKFAGLELRSERPKLELHQRSKPSESLESPVNYKKGYQQPHNSGHPENVPVSYGNVNPSNSELSGSYSGNQAVERPKLNLKPRSQPLEPLEGNTETKRNTVFGGARPRELVLKERGIDDIAIINPDVGQPPNRVKHEVPKTDRVHAHATPTRHDEMPENSPIDNRIRKNNDRRDNRVDAERTDTQRRNWRSENHYRRDNRETEKNQPQERPSSPETWRKPAEKPKTKVASAVELAQAFSRSVSDAKKPDIFPSQRGGPNRGPVPFSRLMDPTSRPQINGY